VTKEIEGQENLNDFSNPFVHMCCGFNVRYKETGAAYSEC